MLTKAFIPYNGYYSSPFCRWQGSMANENAISLGAKTARNWFLKKSWIPPCWTTCTTASPLPSFTCFTATPGPLPCWWITPSLCRP